MPDKELIMPQANNNVVETTNAKPQEDWMARRWRPAMGWLYMAVCAMDFMIFPILWSVLQSVSHGQVTNQWQPLTLQGAGLFHLAMGAVLGIAAYGRTQEKMSGANNGGIAPPTPVPAFGSPAPTPAFGGTPLGGNSASTVPAFGAPVARPAPAFGAPTQPPHPEI
jgi:hypothetical protein